MATFRSPTPRTHNEAFNTAQQQLEELLGSSRFYRGWRRIESSTGDPSGSPRYWSYVSKIISSTNGGTQASPGDALANRAYHLVGKTPAFVCAIHFSRGRLATRADKCESISFGQLTKKFALEHPETSTSWLIHRLGRVAQQIKLPEAIKNSSYSALRSNYRSKSSELAFAQSLLPTGRDFREASLEEDLGGLDYEVESYVGPQHRVDVKAGFYDMRKNGERGPYVSRGAGKIAISLGLTEGDFNDSFFISDALAAQKAVELEAIFQNQESLWAQNGIAAARSAAS